MPDHPSRSRIHLLRDTVARQIAAGEVIDRPFSVVRELLDNAIDAGADSISVHIADGGMRSIRVVDNGTGMNREDLRLCVEPHATSKIETVDDLQHLSTLGFRGEALSSIAACSRLTVTSKPPEQEIAFRLRIDGGRERGMDEAPADNGTSVEVADLFYAIPARRKFLKTPAGETAMCRVVAVEKSLPFPDIELRFFVDGELKLFLPKAAGLSERIAAAYPGIVDPSLLHRFDAPSDSFSLAAVVGGPSLYRRDRKYIQCFVNGRRVDEFALVQAVQYGFADHIPGGNFPVAFFFLTVDPSQVDFNIHPAKREVRFRNMADIHHAVVSSLRAFLARFNTSYDARRGEAESSGAPVGELQPQPLRLGREAEPSHLSPAQYGRPESGGSAIRPREVRPLSELAQELSPRPSPPAGSTITYYGQLFRLFLLASVGERFFIIDQHAAHERLLFEDFRSTRGSQQKLLVPYSFEVTPEDDEAMAGKNKELARLAIDLRRMSPGRWELAALPEAFRSMVGELVEFLVETRGDERELDQRLYARMSCRAAVKEGDSMDELAARDLIGRTFTLNNARCPHGRPIWYELNRTELYHLVGRL